MKRILSLLSLLFLSTNLQAAPAPAIVYEIEAVVFEYASPDLEAGEVWANRDGKHPDSAVTNAISIGEKAPAGSFLSSAATALESSGQHRVLAHHRWRQSAEAKSESKPVRINSEGNALTGGLRLYLSRFLYLDVNLTLQETTGGNAAVDPSLLQKYHVDEHRRIKTAEIHYFDHPKFGALVRVIQAKK